MHQIMKGIDILFLRLTLVLFCVLKAQSYYFKEQLRADFIENFNNKCNKYRFVHQFYKKLEDTGDKYLVFVYQEKGLRNGGLGDRLGGLISAMAISLRFGRTLLIRAHNDLHKIFRPYHPTDILSENPKYNWNNWTSWSNYNPKYENNDNTEYDIWMCINNTGQKNRQCSIDDGDVSQPIILYRSNRAYLCHYDKNGFISHQQMRDILGIGEKDDLYEAAGCMMRLALWPTEGLWEEVDKVYEHFDQSAIKSAVAAVTRRRMLRGALDGTNSTMHSRKQRRRMVSDEDLEELLKKQEKFEQREEKKQLNEILLEDPTEEEDEEVEVESEQNKDEEVIDLDEEEEDGDKTKDNGNDNYPFFQVGMHFRCGDRSYIMHGGYGDTCVYNPNNPSDASKPVFNVGNPYDIALCGKSAFQNHTKQYPVTDSSKHYSLLYIASDNDKASEQMSKVAGHSHTLISPQGCHIEMDTSLQCHLFTVSQWFILALSDVIVTQTGNEKAPTSSFSRYAGIYGLKQDVFRNGRQCEEEKTNLWLSRQQISNWFC